MSSVFALVFREMETNRRCKEGKQMFLIEIIRQQGVCGDIEVNGFV